MSVNRATLVGRVGKDPDVRVFDNGNKVANFSLATSENYKNKDGERVEKTEWHNVAVFGKLVDIVEKYVTKGTLLYLEGKIQTRSWESDGVKKYTTEIVLQGYDSTFKMLGKPQGSNEEIPTVTAEEVGDYDDDLPF